jgi:hypothetical protein
VTRLDKFIAARGAKEFWKRNHFTAGMTVITYLRKVAQDSTNAKRVEKLSKEKVTMIGVVGNSILLGAIGAYGRVGVVAKKKQRFGGTGSLHHSYDNHGLRLENSKGWQEGKNFEVGEVR